MDVILKSIKNLNITNNFNKITVTSEKLEKFKKHWKNIQNQYGENIPGMTVDDTSIQKNMWSMITMLIYEDRNTSDSVAMCSECMEYFLNNDILGHLVELSVRNIPPQGLIRVTIDAYANLCNLINENFLTKSSVHLPLLKLLQFCYMNKKLTRKYEEYIIELLFSICYKIHFYPQLLNIFLIENNRHYECILFDYLKQFIFNTGRTGDMARTSMNYLFGNDSRHFSNYILYIKFPEQLINNLSIIFDSLPKNGNIIKKENKSWNQFLALFLLTQRIVADCPMEPIRNGVMYYFKKIFLNHMLYKRILSSSDFDGTSEAISIYIKAILSEINCIDFSSSIVNFIFENDHHHNNSLNSISNSIIIKNENYDQNDDVDGNSTGYTQAQTKVCIKDLVWCRQNSKNNIVATTNMFILSSLLKQHYRYTIPLLIPSIRGRPLQQNSDDKYLFNMSDERSHTTTTTTTENINELSNLNFSSKSSDTVSMDEDKTSYINSEPMPMTNEKINIKENEVNVIKPKARRESLYSNKNSFIYKNNMEYIKVLNNEEKIQNKINSLEFEAKRYIDLLEAKLKSISLEKNTVYNFKTYINDVNVCSTKQLSGLSFNDRNINYPENIIKEIKEEPNPYKAMDLLKDEPLFSHLYSKLKNFFNNSPEFNLALTDIFFQLLIAPENYLFMFLINSDRILSDKYPSLYTYISQLFSQYENLVFEYTNKKYKLLQSEKDQTLRNEINQFNKNFKILIEFLNEIIAVILEIQLKAEIFESY